MSVTPETINAEYKQAFQDLSERFGGHHAIPAKEIDKISERLRARFVLLANQGENPKTLLRKYGISADIALAVADIDSLDVERQLRRADKWKVINAWCADNIGYQTSAREVAQVGGFSEATAIKFIGDRVDLFKKIRKGIYEIRSRESELPMAHK